MQSAAVEQNLRAGEKLLWSGRPRAGVVFRATDALMVPFSLVWGGFAIFWESSVLATNAPLIFRLWGIPFVLMGLYLIVGRFFFDSWRRGNTYYGVSNDRIIISRGGLGASVTSLPVSTLSEVTLKEKPDRSGTISFGPAFGGASFLAGTAWPGAKQPPAFDLISDAASVYAIIRDAQNEKSARRVS